MAGEMTDSWNVLIHSKSTVLSTTQSGWLLVSQFRASSQTYCAIDDMDDKAGKHKLVE